MNPGTSKPFALGGPPRAPAQEGLTYCGVRDLLLLRIEATGMSVNAWAQYHSLWPTEVSEVIRGMRPPSARILKVLGLKKHIIFVLDDEPQVKNVVEPTCEPCHNDDGRTS